MARWSGKSCRLGTMMLLTGTFFFVEITVGYVTNSLALVADSFHMLSDVVALVVGFASVRISKWTTPRNTYGWQRAEVLGALVNAVFLLALCFSILVESLKRLILLEEVDNPVLMLVVGSIGLLVNLIGLCLFGGHGHSHGGGHGHGHSHGHGHGHGHAHGNQPKPHLGSKEDATMMPLEASKNGGLDTKFSGSTLRTESVGSEKEFYKVEETKTEVVKHSGRPAESLNMRGVFLHVLGDALGSVVVIISALCIIYVEGDWKYYLDPAMSIVMVIIILATTVPLFRETAYILLQTVPRHVNVEAITRELKEIDGIAGVHECHIWQLAGRRIIASAHVYCHNIGEYMTLANQIKGVFHRAGIHSTTIQPEFVEHPYQISQCSMVCSSDDGDKCEQDTCCAPRKLNKPMGSFKGMNNSNSNQDVDKLLPSSAEQREKETSLWNVEVEISPEGDEVVLDLSKSK